jgi:hypothetical protein
LGKKKGTDTEALAANAATPTTNFRRLRIIVSPQRKLRRGGTDRGEQLVRVMVPERMVSEKTVCPAANDDHLRQPRIKRVNQLG